MTLLCVKCSLSCFLRLSSTSVLLYAFLFCSFVSSVVEPASPFHFCVLWALCSTSTEACGLNVLWPGPPTALSWATSPHPSTLFIQQYQPLIAPHPGQEERFHARASALVISSAGCPALDLDMMAFSHHPGSAPSSLCRAVFPDAQSTAAGHPSSQPSLICPFL